MKVPLSWLNEFISTDHSPEHIADLLTAAGLEVDGIDMTSPLPGSEAIFEISLTPNLGHCANITGIARELSAATNQPLNFPKAQFQENSEKPVSKAVKVTVEYAKGCPRYACRVIENVHIKDSPEWLQKRLQACGLRPINNVVDATNYVMFEMGQPLHAFDYDAIEGHEIIVKEAKDAQSFVTLDDKERLLQAGDILICDKSKPIALGGIMGGHNSEVSHSTRNILLEAACFHPGTIRKTSKRLGLQTDSSRRFERCTDPNSLQTALDRAAMLIQQHAGGEILGGIIDVKAQDFAEKIIGCRLSRINQILGTHLSLSEVEEVFQRLHLKAKWDGKDTWAVSVPTFRADITAEIDLIEEVARIYGYNNIRKSLTSYYGSDLPHSPMFLFERKVRSRLVAEGLQEFITCDLIGPMLCNIVKEHLMPEEALVKVLNPTSVEQSILRTTLLPGLLQVAKYNIDHQNHNISGFEVGRIHFREQEQFKELSVVGMIMTGKSTLHHWNHKPHDVDFYDLKGTIENMLKELGIAGATFKASAFGSFHSGRQASIFVDKLEIGSMGEIHPAILRRLDVTQRIYFAELSLADLMQVRTETVRMQPLSIYPNSDRDWTITLPGNAVIGDLLAAITSSAPSILEKVVLVDIYRHEKLGHDKQNATFRFTYRDNNKTIDQETVDSEHGKIIAKITQTLTQ